MITVERNCEWCGQAFSRRCRPRDVARFCSRPCSLVHRNKSQAMREKSAERARGRNRSRHGESFGKRSKEYDAWRSMKRRCASTSRSRAYYADRGISVCQRWTESFEAFLADMGRAPSGEHSLDRINNDGNYEPGNCRWATWSEQMLNRRKLPKRRAA